MKTVASCDYFPAQKMERFKPLQNGFFHLCLACLLARVSSRDDKNVDFTIFARGAGTTTARLFNFG